MVLAQHKNYNLSDKEFDSYGESFDNDFAEYCQRNFDTGVKINDDDYGFESEEDEKKVWQWIAENLVREKLYMYEHSGITISTSKFNCQWDSGQIGFVYVEKKTIRENREGTTPMEDVEIMKK